MPRRPVAGRSARTPRRVRGTPRSRWNRSCPPAPTQALGWQATDVVGTTSGVPPARRVGWGSRWHLVTWLGRKGNPQSRFRLCGGPPLRWPPWPIRGQQTVPAAPGFRQRMRGQRTADAPLGEVRQVEGEVAPPCAVVVPEVMIRVGAGDPDGDSARVHNASTFRQTHQGVH